MPILLSDDELEALEGVTDYQFRLYVQGIRRYMDYQTGIVGIKRKVSLSSLASETYTDKIRGVKQTGNKSRFQVERAIKQLDKAGLLSSKSIVTKSEKRLILECLLAKRDSSIQNKAATWPLHSPATLPATVESKENSIKIETSGSKKEESRNIGVTPQNENPATYPISDRLDKIGYDQRQQFFDLLNQRKFPLAYLSDPRTNAMLEAWIFGNVTSEEASLAMQHGDAQAATRQQRVSRPWYYQDIPFQFRAKTEEAKQQTQEIKHETDRPRGTTIQPPRSRTGEGSRRMAEWVKEQERLEALEAESQSE